MQDHYLQLGLDPEASAEEIAAAIKAKPELESAAQILLNGRRRAAYQRTVSTLRSIGMLRHRLGLDNDDTWFVQTCPDFAPRLHSRTFVTPPAAEAAVANPATAVATEATSPVPSRKPVEAANAAPPWLKPAIVVLALALALALIAWLL